MAALEQIAAGLPLPHGYSTSDCAAFLNNGESPELRNNIKEIDAHEGIRPDSHFSYLGITQSGRSRLSTQTYRSNYLVYRLHVAFVALRPADKFYTGIAFERPGVDPEHSSFETVSHCGSVFFGLPETSTAESPVSPR